MAKKAARAKRFEQLTYKPIHLAINAAEADISALEPGSDVQQEQIRAALRNLTIARLVLECDQSLSPFDYDVNPCGKVNTMQRLLRGEIKRRRSRAR